MCNIYILLSSKKEDEFMVRRKRISEGYLPSFFSFLLEKRNVKRKTLDDRIMIGDTRHQPYRTVVSNGKYFYATIEDAVDLVSQTGLDTFFTEKLPARATENIFRFTDSNRSDDMPFSRLEVETQGKEIIVTDSDGNKLRGEKLDFDRLISWFMATPRRIKVFFVPYEDGRVFLCLESEGEFGTLMLD